MKNDRGFNRTRKLQCNPRASRNTKSHSMPLAGNFRYDLDPLNYNLPYMDYELPCCTYTFDSEPRGDLMNCTTSEIELETIVERIRRGDIDLQPDFQRGEVWQREKKERLIDTILRGWKIPPIHVISSPTSIDEVLDGQQRLSAIRDFFDNDLKINGNIPPIDKEISSLSNLTFSQLPDNTRRRIQHYTLTIVRLINYSPEEPAELFYRLNQPATLTSAEQRNAFYGEPRNQIKQLVKRFENLGASTETIGFSNSRLAYDETISKIVYIAENKSFNKKITARMLADRYRELTPFSEDVISEVALAIDRFAPVAVEASNQKSPACKIRFNKATLLSWFLFTLSESDLEEKALGELLIEFETLRNSKRNNTKALCADIAPLISIFNQRASMASTDGASVVIRDLILHFFGAKFGFIQCRAAEGLQILLDRKVDPAEALNEAAEKYHWGEHLNA